MTNIRTNATKTMKDMEDGEKVLWIEKTNGDKSLENLSPFLIKKVIDNVVGSEIDSARKVRGGKIMVITKNKHQAINLMKLSQITDQIKVSVSLDVRTNQSTGIIFNRDLKYSSDEEILRELKNQKVINIKRMRKKGVDGELYETGLYFLTFSVRELPGDIKVGYDIVKVRQYVSEPMRCFRCLKFGHTQQNCRSEEEEGKVCGICTEKTHTEAGERCTKQPKCVNCGQDHASFAKSCPVYLMEKEIAHIKVIKRTTYGIGRREYMQKHPLGTRTMATALRGRGNDNYAKTIQPPIKRRQDEPPTISSDLNGDGHKNLEKRNEAIEQKDKRKRIENKLAKLR